MNRSSPNPVPLLFGSLLLASVACGRGSDTSSLSEASEGSAVGTPVVSVVHPREASVENKLTLAGNIEPYERAALFAKVTGYLDKIHVDIGDEVKKGDILAELDVPEMLPELRQAEAELVKANANGKLADVTHGRLAKLYASQPGAVIEQNVDLAEAELEVARSEVKVAEAKVAALRAMMSYATIRAPFDGIVTRRNYDTGALIAAGSTKGEPILETFRTDRLRLVFNVPDVVAHFVGPGQEVEFAIDAFPGQSFLGEVSRCANSLMEKTRSMRVEIDLDNDGGRFRPGMYATLRLSYRNIPNALTIPASTLKLKEGEPAVLVVENGLVRRAPVTILQDNGDVVVVRGEIGPTSAVVLAGPWLLEEGQAVRVRSHEESH